MDLHFMLFEFGPAIKLIFELSYIPQPEDFKELTPMQYRAMRSKMSEEDLKALKNQKVMAFLPDDPKVYSRLYNLNGNDLMIVGGDQVDIFARTEQVIENYCKDSGQEFNTVEEKLILMARRLPDVFSKDTPYAIYARLDNLHRNNQNKD